jgi:uncharacterized protein YlxW (UPF0749 family)
MEDMKLLKAMLAKMNANMKSKQEMMNSNQEKVEANEKANQEDLLAGLETDREERKAERKAYQEDLKKLMEEILRANQSKVDAFLTEKQDDRKETTACQKATGQSRKVHGLPRDDRLPQSNEGRYRED